MLGAILRELREKAGLSQEQLAFRADALTAAAASAFEQNLGHLADR
jgi:transcriptional regulator with XRE-family HTH domain